MRFVQPKSKPSKDYVIFRVSPYYSTIYVVITSAVLTHHPAETLIVLPCDDDRLQEIDITDIACFPARPGKWRGRGEQPLKRR